MRKFIALFIFAAAFLQAQNHRFIYEYKFVSDSTQKDHSTSEMMFLDITQNGSKYYSREVYVQDSITKADIEKQMKTGNFNVNIKRSDKGKVRYKVTKDYAKNKTYYNKDDVLMGLNWTANIGTKAMFNPDDLKHIRKLYKNEYHYLDDYDKVMCYYNP